MIIYLALILLVAFAMRLAYKQDAKEHHTPDPGGFSIVVRETTGYVYYYRYTDTNGKPQFTTDIKEAAVLPMTDDSLDFFESEPFYKTVGERFSPDARINLVERDLN